MTDRLTLPSRIWLSWVCLFRVLFDRQFALRVCQLRDSDLPDSAPSLPGLPEPTPEPADEPEPLKPTPIAEQQLPPAALQLLSLLQSEGRLVDFLMQDIAGFDDAEIGAAARVIHDGCRQALREHAEIVPVRTEEEGCSVTLEEYDAAAIRLTGNVQGSPPYTGALRHRGWRAKSLRLPQTLKEHDPAVLAPAEVEL